VMIPVLDLAMKQKLTKLKPMRLTLRLVPILKHKLYSLGVHQKKTDSITALFVKLYPVMIPLKLILMLILLHKTLLLLINFLV